MEDYAISSLGINVQLIEYITPPLKKKG